MIWEAKIAMIRRQKTMKFYNQDLFYNASEINYEDAVDLIPKLIIKDDSEYILDKEYVKRVQEQREQMNKKRKWQEDDEEVKTIKIEKPEPVENDEKREQQQIRDALTKKYRKNEKVKYVKNNTKHKNNGTDF